MTWHFPVITSFILRSQMLSFNSMYKLYISCTNFLSLRMRCRETGCCRCCYARCAVSHNLTRQFGSPMKHMLFASEPGTSQPRPILCASPLKNPALFECKCVAFPNPSLPHISSHSSGKAHGPTRQEHCSLVWKRISL